MAMTKAEQLEHLQELITVAKDSELGYQTAAEHVDNPHLANVFSEYARQRAGFVEELTLEAARISGDVPVDNGTVKGAVVRGWMNLKSALTGGGPEALVAACETGEDSAEAAFERVVNLGLTGPLRNIVEAQVGKGQGGPLAHVSFEGAASGLTRSNGCDLVQ